MNETEIVEATLDWCNGIRKKDGKAPLPKLPKGRRKDGASCPCGKATGVFVNSFTYRSLVGGVELGVLPVGVQLFVNKFDNGQFPEYEEDE